MTRHVRTWEVWTRQGFEGAFWTWESALRYVGAMRVEFGERAWIRAEGGR